MLDAPSEQRAEQPDKLWLLLCLQLGIRISQHKCCGAAFLPWRCESFCVQRRDEIAAPCLVEIPTGQSCSSGVSEPHVCMRERTPAALRGAAQQVATRGRAKYPGILELWVGLVP